MKEYLITLLCVGCICGLAEAIAPRGKGDGSSKHIKLICSLCVLAVVAAPIGELVSELRKGELDIFGGYEIGELEDKYREDFLETLKTYNSDSVSDSLKKNVCDIFEIGEEDVDIKCALVIEDEKCTIDAVTVFLGMGAVHKDPHKICSYVEDITKTKCEIIYK